MDCNNHYQPGGGAVIQNGGKNMTNVKRPCQGCVYFKVCGDNTRTMPCVGRMTKSQQKKNKEGK